MVRRGRLGAALVAAAMVAAGAASPLAAQVGPLPTPLPPKPLPTAPGAGASAPAPTAAPTTVPAPPPTAPPATSAPPTVPPSTVPPTTVPPSTGAPTTGPPTTGPGPSVAPPPGTGGTTSSVPPAGGGPTTTAGPGSEPGGGPAGDATTTTGPTSSTTTTTRPGPPPASLSESSVRAYLDAASKIGTNNSTAALLDALRPLYDLGFSAEEVVAQGFGRFPVGGLAYFRDDFGEFRIGPPEHPHAGIDIFAAFNVPVRSPADGVVTFAEEGLGGKAAYVTEPDGTYYYLAHLSGFAPGLVPGSRVTTGQVIGFNGDSGNAKGGAPHVHFEVRPKGGAAVNPKPYLDRWLEEAVAAVPDLLAPFRQASRPLAAIGVARAFDRRLRAEPAPLDPIAADDDLLAAAFVSPLTPLPLRRDPPLPLPGL